MVCSRRLADVDRAYVSGSSLSGLDLGGAFLAAVFLLAVFLAAVFALALVPAFAFAAIFHPLLDCSLITQASYGPWHRPRFRRARKLPEPFLENHT